MTVREAAGLLGRSTSTVYRWLRKGRLERFEDAGLVVSRQGRRWKIEEKAMDWHPQVNQKYARQDGRTPEDFQFEQWPVSNVHLRHNASGDGVPDKIAALYGCDIPADTPQCNRYVEDKDAPTGYRQLPDPTGMALSFIKFELRDADTGDVLDEDGRDHADGQVTGMMGSGRCELWNRLTPENPVRVRLTATPFFYFINEDGGVMAAYSQVNQGYFNGKEAQSDNVYTLSIDEYGNLFIDGEGRPEPPAPPVELPADWQEGETFGQYIKLKRVAAGLSQFDLGQTISQPWKNESGAETYDPEQWIEWIETDQAALRIEWQGEVVLNSNQIYGLADALGIDGQHLTNLAEKLV